MGFRALTSMAAALAAVLLLAGCSGSGFIDDGVKFSSSEYGVAASPRVIRTGNIPRGGGRYQVGEPYRVAGRWFRPQEDPNYDQTGRASWYGPNFHGRLTANGEVFDQTFLSAAHPTLPLPSYVRVFNMENGRSVIVRVNDRGPFAHDRLIDVSRRTAEVLGFINQGTANVRVTYVGRAPLEGDDSRYLVASINTNGAALPPSQQRPPSPISREAGGIFGSIASIFAYADPAQSEAVVSGAFAATEAMANQAPELQQWAASVDMGARDLDIALGTYADPMLVDQLAQEFALYGAVDVSEVPEFSAYRLTLTFLKSGVTREDVIARLQQLQPSAIDPT